MIVPTLTDFFPSLLIAFCSSMHVCGASLIVILRMCYTHIIIILVRFARGIPWDFPVKDPKLLYKLCVHVWMFLVSNHS